MQENPYQFITDPSHKPKKSLLPGGNSKQGRILIVLGGILLLAVIAGILAALLSSGGSSQKETLLKAAQQQAEIIRVSKIGIDKARDPATRNLAVTTNLSLQSDQATLFSHTKFSSKEIALGKDTKTDVALTTAEQSNRFDEIFTQTIQTKLAVYQQTLKTAYDGTDGPKLKTSLSDLYNHAGALNAKK